MRITINDTTYAEWWTGSRTINIYTMEPYSGPSAFWGPRWANTDCISFGYDKPDNSTTQLEMLAVLHRHFCICPMCVSGIGPCSDLKWRR